MSTLIDLRFNIELWADMEEAPHIKKDMEQALKRLDELIEAVPDLEITLRNATKPSYDFHATCGECGKETKTNNEEWLIWCGRKEDAENLLVVAKLIREAVK